METIQGLTNWQLTVRREEGSVTIMRALTCDQNAVLPDTLFGLPVTALSDRALAAGAAGVEGAALRVLGGAESEEWDNRNIRALTLPRPLESIGDYAFMNLRAMQTLRFWDDLRATGSATFMNCRSFARIELTRTAPTQGPALSSIVRNLQQELDVTIDRTDGNSLRLIFPEYVENYTENTPAHHFELKISGGGYAYHSVFRDKTLSVPDFDSLWPVYIAAEHDGDSALRLAYYRLRCAVGLNETARERYADYLRRRLGPALSFAMAEKDMPGLRLLLTLGDQSPEVLEAALSEARERRLTEATALLLETRRARSGAGREKKWEL